MRFLTLLVCAVCFGMGSAMADIAYPTKPIRLIVDSAPGGVTDIWARRFARYMPEILKQPVVVDNRPGASSSIASEAVKNAPADGYTVLFAGPNVISFPAAGGVVRYDPIADFAPAAIGALGYPILAASATLGVHSIKELIEFAKKQANGVTCGTNGQAASNHFSCALALRALGIKTQMIPYKGGAPAMQDAVAGQIHLVTVYVTEAYGMLTSGKLVGLAVMAHKRLAKLPSIPTFEELGYRDVEFPAFNGFYFPAKTPAAIVEKFSQASRQAMRQPELVEALAAGNSLFMDYTPAQYAAFVKSEFARWKKMSSELDIRVEQ